MSFSKLSALEVDEKELDSFAKLLEAALDHFADPHWLGTNSPLAAPYFLGQALMSYTSDANAISRGSVLQQVLRKAATHLEGELQEVLRVGYFQRDHYLTSDGLALRLNLSRRSYYRRRLKALKELAYHVNQTLLPPLRPERLIEKKIYGRALALSDSLVALQGGQSLYLYGNSGTGKTTLGTAIAQQWLQLHLSDLAKERTNNVEPIFWYTIRTAVNDQPSSFLFALAYFLRLHGAGSSWRQMVADQGAIDAARTLALLRFDFSNLQSRSILLCIDEVDLLQPETENHAQLLHLLEELCPLTPLLLIGQRQVLETDKHIAITGLQVDEISQWMTETGIPLLLPNQLEKLLDRTQGNPALVTLLVALHQSGEELATVLDSFTNAPSLEAIFLRIWRRLNPPQRSLLQQLSIFRNPSPIDAWVSQHAELNILRTCGLIEVDAVGGVRPLSHIHRLIYERTSAEDRLRFHAIAAEVRSARGEVASAVYHHIEARQPALAVWLWFAHRRSEIERGRGPSTLPLLQRVVANELPDKRDRLALRIARAELLGMSGRQEEAEAELTALVERQNDTAGAYVLQLEGDVLEAQGQVEQALEKYRESLNTLQNRHARVSRLHSRLSFIYAFRLQNFAQARHEALNALIVAQMHYGNITEWTGNLQQASDIYGAARALAENDGVNLGVKSQIHSYIGTLELKQRKFQSAIEHFEKAIAIDQSQGDVVRPLYDQLNLAYANTLIGNYDDAYQQSCEALAVAEQMKHGYLIAGLSAGAGEACYYLNRLDESEQYAIQSLAQKEAFFRSSALTLYGMVRGAQGKYKEAVDLIQNGIESAHAQDDLYGEAYAWRKLGDVHADHNQNEQAHLAYSTAIRLYRELGLDHEIKQIEQALDQLTLPEQ